MDRYPDEGYEVISLMIDFRFAEPLITGDYPQLCRDTHGERLPRFTDEQQKLLKGSSDFLA